MKTRGTLLKLLQIYTFALFADFVLFFMDNIYTVCFRQNTNMGVIYLNLFSPIFGTLGGIPITIIGLSR